MQAAGYCPSVEPDAEPRGCPAPGPGECWACLRLRKWCRSQCCRLTWAYWASYHSCSLQDPHLCEASIMWRDFEYLARRRATTVSRTGVDPCRQIPPNAKWVFRCQKLTRLSTDISLTLLCIRSISEEVRESWDWWCGRGWRAQSCGALVHPQPAQNYYSYLLDQPSSLITGDQIFWTPKVARPAWWVMITAQITVCSRCINSHEGWYELLALQFELLKALDVHMLHCHLYVYIRQGIGLVPTEHNKNIACLTWMSLPIFCFRRDFGKDGLRLEVFYIDGWCIKYITAYWSYWW